MECCPAAAFEIIWELSVKHQQGVFKIQQELGCELAVTDMYSWGMLAAVCVRLQKPPDVVM